MSHQPGDTVYILNQDCTKYTLKDKSGPDCVIEYSAGPPINVLCKFLTSSCSKATSVEGRKPGHAVAVVLEDVKGDHQLIKAVVKKVHGNGRIEVTFNGLSQRQTLDSHKVLLASQLP